MILVKESGGILGYTDVTRAHATPYVMMETDGCKNGVEAIRRKEYERYSGRHIKHASSADKDTELPAGQVVTITKISEDTVFDSEEIIAYGTVKPSQFDHEIKFAYGWTSYFLLAPAPWEPSGTPPIRRRVEGSIALVESLFNVSEATPTWGEPVAPK